MATALPDGKSIAPTHGGSPAFHRNKGSISKPRAEMQAKRAVEVPLFFRGWRAFATPCAVLKELRWLSFSRRRLRESINGRSSLRSINMNFHLAKNENRHFTLCLQRCGWFHAPESGEPPKYALAGISPPYVVHDIHRTREELATNLENSLVIVPSANSLGLSTIIIFVSMNRPARKRLSRSGDERIFASLDILYLAHYVKWRHYYI